MGKWRVGYPGRQPHSVRHGKLCRRSRLGYPCSLTRARLHYQIAPSLTLRSVLLLLFSVCYSTELNPWDDVGEQRIGPCSCRCRSSSWHSKCFNSYRKPPIFEYKQKCIYVCKYLILISLTFVLLESTDIHCVLKCNRAKQKKKHLNI